MSRNFVFSEGEFYHCYSRGTEKRKIFLSTRDYERFLHLLFVCNSKKIIHLSDFREKKFDEIFYLEREDTLVEIGAYCLMPNHFHILLREKQKGGISLFMQKIMTAYTMFFNKKYSRTGALFGTRFKAEHIDGDEYLKYIFSYLHLNPVKLIDPKWKERGTKNFRQTRGFINKYAYSSYQDYINVERSQNQILNKKAFPSYFRNREEAEEEIFEWLNFAKVATEGLDMYDNPKEILAGSK